MLNRRLIVPLVLTVLELISPLLLNVYNVTLENIASVVKTLLTVIVMQAFLAQEEVQLEIHQRPLASHLLQTDLAHQDTIV